MFPQHASLCGGRACFTHQDIAVDLLNFMQETGEDRVDLHMSSNKYSVGYT